MKKLLNLFLAFALLCATNISAMAKIPGSLGFWTLDGNNLNGFVEFDFVPGAPNGDYVLDISVPNTADKDFLAFGNKDFGLTLSVPYNIPADDGIRVGVSTSQSVLDGLTEDKQITIEARAGNDLTEQVGFGSGTGIVTLKANTDGGSTPPAIGSAEDLFIAAFFNLGGDPPTCTISELEDSNGESLMINWTGKVKEQILSDNLSLIGSGQLLLNPKGLVDSADQSLADGISSLIQQFVTAKVRFPRNAKSLFRISRSDGQKNSAAIQASSVTVSDLTRDSSGNLNFVASSALPASAFAKKKLSKINDKGSKNTINFKAKLIPNGTRAIRKHLNSILEKSTKKLPVSIDLTTDDGDPPTDEN